MVSPLGPSPTIPDDIHTTGNHINGHTLHIILAREGNLTGQLSAGGSMTDHPGFNIKIFGLFLAKSPQCFQYKNSTKTKATLSSKSGEKTCQTFCYAFKIFATTPVQGLLAKTKIKRQLSIVFVQGI